MAIKSLTTYIFFAAVLCGFIQAQAPQQRKVTGIMGKSVKLDCDLPTTTPPQITWVDWVYNTGRDAISIFNGTTINPQHPNKEHLTVTAKGKVLMIQALELGGELSSDAGEYICKSVQTDGSVKEKSIQVNIIGKPQCAGATDLTEGTPSLLTCTALFSGSANPVLDWFMGVEKLESIDMNNIGKARKDYTIGAASHEQDGKTFTCKMTLGEFTEECSLAMTVTYKVRDLEIIPQSDKVRVNEEIRCTAKGNPKPKIDLKVTTEGDAMVDIMDSGDYKAFKVGKELEGQTITVACTASNTFDGKVENLSTQSTYTVVAPPTTTTTTTTTTEPTTTIEVKTVVPVTKKDKKEPPTPKPEETGPGQKTGGNVVGIVAGVIIAALVIVVIVIAVVCIRRKNTKKNKGTKVPTKEEEARRLEDGRGGSAVAYSDGEKHGRYRRTNITGSPSNGALPYDGVGYHKTTPGDADVDLIGNVDLDNNHPFSHQPTSRVDFTENDYTQILHPDTITTASPQ